MNYNEVIKNLEYLISEDCTETQFDYEDEIDIAIRVMKSTNNVYSKIDKVIENIKQDIIEHSGTGEEVIQAYCDGLKKALEYLENIGE